MLFVDCLAAFEVGYGACHFEDAVVGTGREVEFLHGIAQQCHGLVVELYILLQKRCVHLCVAMHSFDVLVAFHLYAARIYHSLADGRAGFAFGSFGYVFKGDALYLYLYVDAVHERAAYLVHVAVHLGRCAHASARGMVKIAAGAWVHGGHEHEGARQGEVVARAGNGDDTIFERLAKGFKNAAAELWQLVEEENAIVCKAYLARHEDVAASDEGYVRHGMVRGAEWALTDEGGLLGEFASYGVYLCCLKTLIEAEWREDRWQTFGHHGLATSRRTNKYDIVSTCCSHFEGSFDIGLSLDLIEVKIEGVELGVELLSGVDDCGFELSGAL